MERTVRTGLYRHYKGSYVRFLAVAVAESGARMAVYQTIPGNMTRTMLYVDFARRTKPELEPDAKQEYVYELVSPTSYELNETGHLRSLENEIYRLEDEIGDLRQHISNMMRIAKMMEEVEDEG